MKKKQSEPSVNKPSASAIVCNPVGSSDIVKPEPTNGKHIAQMTISCKAKTQAEAFKLFEQISLPKGVTIEGIKFEVVSNGKENKGAVSTAMEA